jgi:hypothetical protein
LRDAESKDPDESDLAYEARTFSSTEIEVRTLEVEKVKKAWSKSQSSGSFDCVARKSASYFAQDDGFLEGIEQEARGTTSLLTMREQVA